MKSSKIPIFTTTGNHDSFLPLSEKAPQCQAPYDSSWNNISANNCGDCIQRYFYYIGDPDFNFSYGPARYFIVNSMYQAYKPSDGKSYSWNFIYDQKLNPLDFRIRYRETDKYSIFENERNGVVSSIKNSGEKFNFIFTHNTLTENMLFLDKATGAYYDPVPESKTDLASMNDFLNKLEDMARKGELIASFSGHYHAAIAYNMFRGGENDLLTNAKDFLSGTTREVAAGENKRSIRRTWVKVDVNPTQAEVRYVPINKKRWEINENNQIAYFDDLTFEFKICRKDQAGANLHCDKKSVDYIK